MNDYFEKILQAEVYEVAKKTPLEKAHYLSKKLNNEVLLKREDLQDVFSFKIRGAYNKMSKLTNSQLAQGVITSSAGNHAQGVALSALKLNCQATIFMPITTPIVKVNAVKNLKAKVILYGDNYDETYKEAIRISQERNLCFIHPFDDPDVIAGQGTIAIELEQQLKDIPYAIYIAVGGGGLISGISLYVKKIWPEFNWYIEGGEYYIGVQTKRGCPHNCCFCVYTVVEGKQVRVNPVNEVIKEMKQLYDLGVRGFWFTDAQFIPAKKHIEDAKTLLQAIKDQGWDDINWAAYIRADNIDAELAKLMVDTGMSYFEIGITSGSQELVRKMRLAYDLETVLNNCRMLVQSGFKNHVSVNYSFNVFDETPSTIRQTIAYHRELENIFGKGLVDPAIFFIGLQPHTLLEKYALEHKILKPNYNPMSMMPWTARKLLWNPGSLGEKLGQVCLEAFDNPEDEFGKTVIDILEREYGKSSLKESLKVRPLSERKLTHSK